MTDEELELLATQITEAIVDDLRGRSGLGNEWDMIDPETQTEILEAWKRLTAEKIREVP